VVRLRDVRGDSAQNPEALDGEILPSFGRPHKPPLLTFFALEAQPAILVAHGNMGSRAKWPQSAIGIESAIVFGVSSCSPRVVATPIALSSLGRGRTDKPHVPMMPVRIHKISETHLLALTTKLAFEN
jgi:hypothetical protein